MAGTAVAQSGREPRAAGLTPVRLARLRAGLARYVERGEVVGVAALISRRGAPITAAAAMILVEEGRIGLDGPRDPWLPELAARRVLRRIDAALEDIVPVERALTLRDLLTLRLGFGMLVGPPDRHPIQRAITQLQLWDRKPWPPHTSDEWLRRWVACR